MVAQKQTFGTRYQINNAVIRSIPLYGAEIWKWTEAGWK